MSKKINIVKPDFKDIYENLLTVFKYNMDKMNTKIDTLSNKLDKNEQRMINLDDKISNILLLMRDKKIVIRRKDVKIQKFIIEEDFSKDLVLKNLTLRGVRGDLNLVKKYYLSSDHKSIELINQRRFEYWNDGRWHIDMDGHFIGKALTNNLQMLYTSINFLSNVENNVNTFMQNQVHINKLSTEKYRKELIKNLKLEL